MSGESSRHGQVGESPSGETMQPDLSHEPPSDATQPPCTQPPSLVDMPAWLLQLPKLIADAEEEHESPGLLALFRTCTVLRDLVASQRTLSARFQPMPPDQASALAAQAKLVLACKHASNITLCLSSDDVRQPLADPEASASSLMHGAMAAAGHALESITRVRLTGLPLSAVVPSWLALTCPNMTYLRHLSTGFTLPDPTISLPACGQVSKLSLWFGDEAPSNQSMQLRWQHQLRALTGLTSLEVHYFTRSFLSCCSVLGAQLTALEWHDIPSADMIVRLPMQLPVWFPCLRELKVEDAVVDDQGMEVLLSMQLQQLTCSRFQLQHSYTHRPCTWQHLGFQYLDISAFDRLPLQGVQSMGLDVGAVRVVPSPGGDLGAITRVAAAVARCGGITATKTWLSLGGGTTNADSASLAAAMAVAHGCKVCGILVSKVSPVTAELLAAISQHLPSSTAAHIWFHECTFASEAPPLLLPSLPSTIQCVKLMHTRNGQGEPTEAQVATMCAHACHPITMDIAGAKTRWQEGWQQRLQAAMAAVGHQHVQFKE